MNKLMKTLLSLAIVLMLMFSIVGCAGQDKKDTDTEQKEVTEKVTEEKVDLELLYIWPEYETTMTKTIEQFTNNNPNINMEVNVTPWNEVVKVLQTRMASGDVPDVSFMWPHRIGQFVANNQALELTSYMTEEWESSFLSPDELKPGYVDGKLYDIPFKGTAQIIFYNKDVMDEAGIEFPKYVEDIPAAGEKAKEIGATLLGLAGKPNGYQFDAFNIALDAVSESFILGLGEDPEWKLGRLWTEEMAEASTKAKVIIKDYVDNGYIAKNGLAMTREEVQTQFITGKVLAIQANNNEYSSMKEVVDFNLGVALIPNWKEVEESPLVGGSFDGFFASSETKHPDEAVALLKHLTSKDVQNLWCAETGCAGVVKDLTIEDGTQNDIVQLFSAFSPYIQQADYTYNKDEYNIIKTEFLFKDDVTPEMATEKSFAFRVKSIESYDEANK